MDHCSHVKDKCETELQENQIFFFIKLIAQEEGCSNGIGTGQQSG